MTLRPRATGFTLVEAMVALVVLALISLALTSATRTLGDAQQRLAAAAQTDDRQVATARLLQTLLGQAVRDNYTPGRDEPGWPQRRIRFAVNPQSIEWVGIMPARPAMGGMTQFRLALEPGPHPSQPQRLVLRHRPHQPADGVRFAPWDDASAEILLDDVQELRIRVRGPRPAGWSINQPWHDAWRDDWPATVRDVPAAVRLDISDARGPWPPLFVAMYATPPSASGLGRAVVGGGEVD